MADTLVAELLREGARELAQAHERISALESALRPFARLPIFPTDADRGDDAEFNYWIRAGDLRVAKKVMAL